MKDAFNKSLKGALENYEAPYNDAAWQAMSARLDANSGSSSFESRMKEGLNANVYPYNPDAWKSIESRLDNKPKSGRKNWFVAAGVLGVVVITGLLIWSTNRTKSNDETKSIAIDSNTTTAKTSLKNKSNVAVLKEDKIDSQQELTQSTTTRILVDQENDNELTDSNKEEVAFQNQRNTTSESSSDKEQGSDVSEGRIEENATISGTKDNSDAKTPITFIQPKLPTHICEGETIQIENTNEFPIVIIYPNGLNWLGNAQGITRLNPSLSGTYRMGYIAGDQFEEVSTFEVSTAPLAAFDFVDITQRYLNGLPTIEVRATAKAESYNWEYANGKLRGDDVDLHFFEKGMHDVRLTVTNELGCSSTTQQSVYVEEDYNLMAMDAFVPNGINTTFMPYALTERNTPFTMVIIDPNDGHVMYETSDASQGWDGTDQQTGSPAPIDKSYIWKVTLQNPEHGESSIYSGTVLMLSK